MYIFFTNLHQETSEKGQKPASQYSTRFHKLQASNILWQFIIPVNERESDTVSEVRVKK